MERSRTTGGRYSGKTRCQSPENESSNTVEEYKEVMRKRKKIVLTTALGGAWYPFGALSSSSSHGRWSERQRRGPGAQYNRVITLHWQP